MTDSHPNPSRLQRAGAAVREALRRYFVTGVLVFAPIAVTAWVVLRVVQILDNALLPQILKLAAPGIEEAPRIPLVGAVFTLLFILLLGVIARHFFGMEAVRLGERLLARVPIARSIYNGVKQLVEAIFLSPSRQGFRRVVLIEYPRKGIYAIAFTTGPARGIVQDATPGTMINCFVPTTPNPTSGFYLLVPERELIAVDMTVEEAFKLVMSGGLVVPDRLTREPEPAVRAVPPGPARAELSEEPS
jgi:uncharacterized membrane protein